MRLLALAAVLLVGPASSAEVVGVARCRSCQSSAFEQWSTTPHARAAAKLSAREQVDPACTSCHSTDAAAGHLHVQCESCHGPGERYWPAGVMADPRVARALGLEDPTAERMCRRCHGQAARSVRRFDYPSALHRVRHGNQKEQR